MLWGHLAGRDILVLGDVGELGRGGDVEDVDRPPRRTGERDDPPRRQHRALVVAPHRMRRRVAGDALTQSRLHARLVLGMDRDPAAARGEHARQLAILGHEQVTGRCAHEDLDPGRARQPLQIDQLLGIGRCRADIESMVAPHPIARAGELVGQRLGGIGIGLGVRHLEHRDDAAQHGGAAAALQILLRLQPRLAEMDLAVDHAGQHGQPGAVDRLAGIARLADRDDPAAAHADRCLGRAAGGPDNAVGEEKVIGGHVQLRRPCVGRGLSL